MEEGSYMGNVKFHTAYRQWQKGQDIHGLGTKASWGDGTVRPHEEHDHSPLHPC